MAGGCTALSVTYRPCGDREGGKGRAGMVDTAQTLTLSPLQWMTCKFLATERYAVSTLWEPPGTPMWKSKKNRFWGLYKHLEAMG